MYFIYFDYIHISSRETKKKEDHTGSSSWELYSLTEWYYTKHRFKLIEVSIPPEQCPPHTRCLCLCMKRFVREWISKKVDAKRHISWPLISHGQYYDCIKAMRHSSIEFVWCHFYLFYTTHFLKFWLYVLLVFAWRQHHTTLTSRTTRRARRQWQWPEPHNSNQRPQLLPV